VRPPPTKIKLSLPRLHTGQLDAYWALKERRFKALRCGRRFGKTEFAKTWIADALARGWESAWLAPRHKTWSETYAELADLLRPILKDGSKGSGVLRVTTGGRLDFWTLENPIAGRGRRYRRVVIDEAAFAKDGDSNVDGSMMEIWEKSIKPTLFDNSLREAGAALQAVSCSIRINRRMDRGQELRDDPAAAGAATPVAGSCDRIAVDLDGQGRARNFCFGLRSSRKREVLRPCAQQDRYLQRQGAQSSCRTGRKLSRRRQGQQARRRSPGYVLLWHRARSRK
jgi:hypothetical protein